MLNFLVYRRLSGESLRLSVCQCLFVCYCYKLRDRHKKRKSVGGLWLK